jgi:hypothetical protein
MEEVARSQNPGAGRAGADLTFLDRPRARELGAMGGMGLMGLMRPMGQRDRVHTVPAARSLVQGMHCQDSLAKWDPRDRLLAKPRTSLTGDAI